MDTIKTQKKVYKKPSIASKQVDLPVMACTCSGSGSLSSFLQLATNNFNSGT